MDDSETDGVRYELLLSGAAEQDTLSYRGSLQLGDQRYPLSVDVFCDGSGADGLRVEASCPQAPERGRKALERTAGIMTRSAVRGARKHKLAPPRRVRRWRPLPREMVSPAS